MGVKGGVVSVLCVPTSWYRGVLVGVLLSGLVLLALSGRQFVWPTVVLVVAVVAFESVTRRFSSSDPGVVDVRERRSHVGRIGYWLLVAVLIVFGTLTGFSIGLPFLLVGLTLGVLWPARRVTTLFWPVLAGEFGLIVSFVLVEPGSCTTSSSSASTLAHTTCSNVIGLDYSWAGVHNPSYLPSLLAGVGAGGAAALVTWIWLHRRPARR